MVPKQVKGSVVLATSTIDMLSVQLPFSLCLAVSKRCSKLQIYPYKKLKAVNTLLGNPKGPVELGNPNIYAEVKLCLFMPAPKIVCRESEVL